MLWRMGVEFLAERLVAADRAIVERLNTAARHYGPTRRLVRVSAERLAAVEVVLMAALAVTAGRRRAAVHMLGAVAVVYVASEALGLIWPRERPFARCSEIEPLVSHTSARSFPSRHVAAGLAMALVGQRAHPRLGGVMISVALGLGVSRIAAGLHFPSDVAAGAVLGGLVGRMLRP
jgi:undecaprenyl-diphosphatase